MKLRPRAQRVSDEFKTHLFLIHFSGIFLEVRIHFNAKLWKIHQLFVLQVLYEKERIPARKAEKLAKVANYVATEFQYN